MIILNCRTSIAHMDSPKIVDLGLSQMLSLVLEDDDAELDVHYLSPLDYQVSLSLWKFTVFCFECFCNMSTPLYAGTYGWWL